MRQLIKDHFVHCDDVKPSLCTPVKAEVDEIVNPSLFLKKRYNLLLILKMSTIVQLNFEETAIIHMIMPIHVEIKRLFLKKIWL